MLSAVTERNEKLAYSIREAAEAASLSVPYLRLQIKDKVLKAKLVGRRVLILREDLNDYLKGKEDWSPISERHN